MQEFAASDFQTAGKSAFPAPSPLHPAIPIIFPFPLHSVLVTAPKYGFPNSIDSMVAGLRTWIIQISILDQ